MIDLKKRFTGSSSNNQRLSSLTYVDNSTLCGERKGRFQRSEKGLFAKDNIKAGTYIGEYTGQLITKKEFYDGADVEHTYIKWLDDVDPDQPVFKEFENPTTGEKISLTNRVGIDGQDLLRFANHSRHEPNMSMQGPFYYAARDIKAGEELTWCYGDYDFTPEKPLFTLPKWMTFWRSEETTAPQAL